MCRRFLFLIPFFLFQKHILCQSWSIEKSNDWYNKQAWMVGCNYIPSTAVNQLEMWQSLTFDPQTIHRELGWASEIGMNTVRVFLHDLAYNKDAPLELINKMNTFLAIAQLYGIKTSFVFFDDCWNENPHTGIQPEPVIGKHNSQWVQSPGKAIVNDDKEQKDWKRLEDYVKTILFYFKNDSRVIYWDLYNEPGNSQQFNKSLPLLKEVYKWAREVNPSQPITSGVWSLTTPEMKDFQLKESDIISFHEYGNKGLLTKKINALRRYGKPLVCTEWLARSLGSQVKTHLPLFKEQKVGCLNWGLVAGKTQTIYSWFHKDYKSPTKVWFHDLLDSSGKAYRDEEINLFKKMCFNTMPVKIIKENFDEKTDNGLVSLFTLKNKKGTTVLITNYGARVVSLIVPDKNGNFSDIVLGFDSIDKYFNAEEKYFGATIGRYANRIAHGTFNLNGRNWILDKNNGNNHLHGGEKGFHNSVWKASQLTENRIELSYLAKEEVDGYPGNLDVKVIYEITEDNELKIMYEATCDKTTIVNLTHHSFFNLKGEGNGNILNHELKIFADAYTPVDRILIPTGNLYVVDNGPFDFKNFKKIGADLNKEDEQLDFGLGYDHNFMLNKSVKRSDGLWQAAEVYEPESGRVMQVWTNEPGLQFYSGNFLNGKDIGKSKRAYGLHSAFCLETQHFPDSPNQPFFPSTVLFQGEKYSSVCVYKFDVR